MKYPKKINLICMIILFVAAVAFTSFTSNKKCNGKRGIRTPMGVM